MREKYEEELRVAQTRGVVSQEEAEALLAEGLRQGRHPLDLLVEDGVISEETLAAIQAAARGAAVPPGEKPQEGATLSFKRPAAEPSPRQDVPLTPVSPTLTIHPAPPQAETPPRRDVPLTPASPTLTINPTPPHAETPPRKDVPLTPTSPTLSVRHTPSAAEPSPQEPAFPVLGWERYQPVRFLGQGGMGRVYLAYDPVLRRNVALKFVRGDDPELIRRFISEAQAQARVEHERVCKVYEVGEVQGQPFIAMQYVDGRSLLEVARELSVEQKLMAVQQATEGVHAAHRAGLIHRDIKPTNILVERGEDGRWKPYVMDFGLARDWQRESTVTGTVLGTPHYMAPEQARGEVSRLDRRADVYSLGATLYVLLTGKAPIPGSNALEVLSNLATQEPRPLRELDRNVPADLEAIVLKCLEREPSARYDSARALAEDLGRFLNGEPVQARAVGLWYRLRKRARKHWALVSMATVVLVLIALSLGQAVLNSRNLDQRERLARRFAELASDVGSRARYMALSRLHDTSAERKDLRAKLDEIDKEMQQDGERALGPGHYALGQGWLELGDPAKAREHLEAAWQHDFTEPGVASALSLALGQLYREQLLSLDSLAPEERQARRDELARLYRAPALTWLRLSQGNTMIPPEYMKALLAFYEERFDDALASLDALGERLPWFYEAPKLRGDILLTRAWTRWYEEEDSQKKRAQIRADLEKARQAFAQAADTAQSAPEVHFGLALVEEAASSMKLDGQEAVKPQLKRALEHLSHALQAAPDHVASLAKQAALYRNLAENGGLRTGDTEELMRKALETSKNALALNPSHQKARKELGMALWRLADQHKTRGQDPREELRQASEVFESFKPDERDFFIHHGLGLIFKTWANYEEQIGVDSLSHLNKAIEELRESLRLKQQYSIGWINLAAEYCWRATNPRAPAPDEDLAQAWQAVGKSLALNSQEPAAHFQAGRIQLLRARRLRDTGGDERPELARALASCRLGLAIDPGYEFLHNLTGMVLQDQARGSWDRGEDPLPLLDQAQKSFEQARDLDPQNALSYNNLADLNCMRALYLNARAQDPRPSAQAALQAARASQERAPADIDPLINQGHASQLLGAFTLEAQGDPRPHLAEATEKLQQALERARNNNAEAWLYVAETRAIQARWLARQGRAADKDFEKAAQAYQQALESAQLPQDYRLAFGRFYREWAAWRQRTRLDPQPPLDRGLELASTMLAARPTWAEAQALHASLQVLLYKSRPGAAPQLSQALQELHEALRANPNLKRTWEGAAHLAN